MKAIVKFVCIAALSAIPVSHETFAREKPPVRVLLVTGGHDFDEAPFYAMLRSLPGIAYKEVKHPEALVMLRPENRPLYDVILLYDMPDVIGEREKSDFIDCLKAGKGLVALHHAYCSYQNWPEYRAIIGGRYHQTARTDGAGAVLPASTYKHDVRFRVKRAARHAVTKGVKDFDIVDETYGNGSVDPGVRVLLATDEPTATPAVAWTNRYGASNVVTILLGHDRRAWENPNFVKLLTQAVMWVK